MAFSSIDVKRQSWNINCEWALWMYVIQDQIFGILWGVSNNIDSLNIPKCHYDYCKITEAVIKMRGYFVAFNSILLLRKRGGRDNKRDSCHFYASRPRTDVKCQITSEMRTKKGDDKKLKSQINRLLKWAAVKRHAMTRTLSSLRSICYSVRIFQAKKFTAEWTNLLWYVQYAYLPRRFSGRRQKSGTLQK